MRINTQLTVGPIASASPAAVVDQRAGQLGDTIVSELHGGFYEQVYRGNVFSTGHTAVAALSANTITLTATTTPILGVYNPLSSTVNVVMLQAALRVVANNLTSGAGPGMLVWASSISNASISTGLTPINRKTLAASGSQARGFAGATALTGLTNNLVIFEGAGEFEMPSGLTYTTLASTSLLPSYGGVQTFDGSIIVPPGGVLALLNTTSSTVFSAVGRLLWEEVPL
jgi:hypothetical protein